MFIVKFLANGLVATLDFTLGAAMSTFILTQIGREIDWETILWGGFWGLFPDLDFFFLLNKNLGQKRNHHRSIMHYPLFTLSVMVILAWSIAGLDWAKIALCCGIIHFVHDFVGINGIVIFWPFSDRQYDMQRSYLKDASPLDRWIRKVGQNYHNIWLSKNWLRLSKLGVMEIALSMAIATITVLANRDAWPIMVPTSVSLVSYLLLCCYCKNRENCS